MSVEVQGPDGKTYEFPDGTDKAAAIGYFKKKGIGVTKQTPWQKFSADRVAGKLPKGHPETAQEGLSYLATDLGNISQREAEKGTPPLADDLTALGHKADKKVPPMVAPRSGLSRAGHQILSGLAGGGQVIAKIGAGLMDWKTAAGLLLSKLSPAASAAFFATQGASGAYDAIKNGDASPENVQNFLLALWGIVGSVAAGAESGDTGITPSKIREKVSGTRPVKALVKETQAENVKDATDTAAENKAVTEKHVAKTKAIEESNRAELARHQQEVDSAARENLKAHVKHLSEKADVEHGPASAKAAQEARGKLEQDIQQDSELLDVKTEKARHDALAEGNKKYSAVNEKLSPIAGDSAALTDSLHDSMSRISGTDVQPPILKSISDRLEEAEPSGVGGIAYSDLQGYYSELGRELSKGTLPGDVYSAYDTMHDAIGEQMQKIADEHGAGAQLKEARAYWKRMKQTFGKSSDAANNRAAKFLGDEAGQVLEQQQRAYRMRLLGSFDESIPRLTEKIAKARSDLKALPSETAATKELSPSPEAIEVAPPKTKPLPREPKLRQPAPKKIGATDVEAAKREGLSKKADWLRTRGQWAATWPVFYVLRDAVRGNGFPIGEAALESGATLAATHAVAHALENPSVVKFLSTATAKDVAAIPPDLRGSFPGIVQQAVKQGTKVSPALRVLFSGASSAPPAPRRHPSDEYSDPSQLQ